MKSRRSIFIVTLFLCCGCINAFKNNSIKISRTETATHSTTNLDIPFTTGTDTDYLFSDVNLIEIRSDYVRLKPVDQSDNVNNGFAGSTLNGLQWDSTNKYLRLSSVNNYIEHDSTWTPKYSSLAGYWKLDEASYSGVNGEVVDSSTIGNGGTASVAMTNVNGKIKKAGVFDGASTAIFVPDNGTYDGIQKLSVSVWMKPTNLANSSSAAQGIVGKRISFANNQSWDFYLENNQLFVDVDAANNRQAVTYTFEDNRWYNLVFVFDGTLNDSSAANNRMKIYINNVLAFTGPANVTTIPSNASDICIGCLASGGVAQVFIGQLDEVAIWRDALNATDVNLIYKRQSPYKAGEIVSRIMDSGLATSSWTSMQAQSTIPFLKELPATNGSEIVSDYSGVTPNLMNGLLAYWKLNEIGASGANSIVDSSGNGNHITPVDTANGGEFTEGSDLAVFTASPKISGTRLTTGQSLLNNRTNFTISGWVRPLTNYDVNKTVVDATYTRIPFFGQHDVFEVGMIGGQVCVSSDSDGTSGCTAYTLELNKWHHVIATANTTEYKLYVDGKLEVTLAHGGGTYGSNAFKFNLAYDVLDDGASGMQFNGWMDEVSVWNRTLSADEAKNIYRRGSNRIFYLVRTCANNDCSDQDALVGKGWFGAVGNSKYYLSEWYNYSSLNSSGVGVGVSNTGGLNIPFSLFSGLGTNLGEPNVNPGTRRYVQYRAYLESDDANNLCDYGSGAESCSPELQTVSFGPDHFTTTAQTITSKASLGTDFTALDSNSLTETLGALGCAKGVRYTISNDGTSFYYFDGAHWVVADGSYTQTNTASVISSHSDTFAKDVAVGTLQVKAFLKSDGFTACELSNLSFSLLKN